MNVDKRTGKFLFTIDGKTFSGTILASFELKCSIHMLRKLMDTGTSFELNGKKVSYEWVAKEKSDNNGWAKRKAKMIENGTFGYFEQRKQIIKAKSEYTEKAEMIKKINIRERTKLIPIKSYFKYFKGVFLEFNYKGILQMTYSKDVFMKKYPDEFIEIRKELKKSFKHSLINKPYLGTNPFDYEDIRSRQLY